jgi:hypothetical protein
LDGFAEKSKAQGGGTIHGFVGLLLQPTAIKTYFRDLIFAKQTPNQINVQDIVALEKAWIDMAAVEPHSIAAGKYFGKLVYQTASASQLDEDKHWLITSCFPNKFKACMNNGMAKYSRVWDGQLAVERVRVFYENASDTFQKLAGG